MVQTPTGLAPVVEKGKLIHNLRLLLGDTQDEAPVSSADTELDF